MKSSNSRSGQAPDFVSDFDPANPPPECYDNPYPVYHALREHDPVHRCPNGSYFLTRYDDLHRIYRDPKTFSSDKHVQFKPMFGDSLLYEHHTTSLVFNDPPLHTHVRKAFGSALSAKAIIAMEADVRALVERLLAEIDEKREFDLINDFASVIPVEVIGNLLRVPHEERGPLRQWSMDILGALEFNLTEERFEAGNRSVAEFLDYLEGLVADRRKNLSDDYDDILSRLIRWESDGFRLSNTQLYHQCIFLLNAGHETTTNLIGNGIHDLLRNPDEMQKLREQPELINSAVEEMLRYESPVQLGNRITTADVDFGDVRIPEGTILTLCIGAANRDPEMYPEPDRFDISRNPQDHLAFGGGIHTCAGLNVARLEARIAIGEMVSRYPGLILNGKPVRDQRTRFRGFLSLPVSVK